MTLPAEAFRVADCADATAETVAVKAALVALAGTTTVAGTAAAVLLLERLTTNPAVGAAALRVTEQADVPAPVKDAVLQEIVVRAGSKGDETPAPLMLTAAVELVDELLVMVRIPVNELTWGAANCIFKVTAWPGARVRGATTPDAVNSDPAMEMPEMVTDAVPVDVRMTGSVADWPTGRLPKARLLVLRLNISDAAAPAPLIFTIAVGLVGELLAMVRIPVNELM